MSAHLPRIEWEGLRIPWEVEDLAESPILPPGSESVKLWRDEQYRIGAKIVGTPDGSFADLLPNVGEVGEIIPDYRIEGASRHGGYYYELDHCVVSRASVESTGKLEADLKTYRARRIATTEREPQAWLTEWYLNAHDRALLYTRSVEREFKETHRRKRAYPKEENHFEGIWSQNLGLYAYVGLPDLGFIVERVPQDLGPSWCRSLAIEYRDEWGGVPDEETRASIANAVSFVMGRPLIGVGHTVFDGSGHPIEEIALSPLQKDLVSACQRAEHPPVKLDRGRPTDLFEVLLARLVPRYLELNDEFDLDNVLWGYWLFEELPLGANLPVLATSVEMLKRSWYSSLKSKSRGVYMPKKEFEELLKDELDAIEKKLEKVEYGDRMARRMWGSFNFGSNESMEFFFEELGLPIGPTEQSALRARNPMAHGSSALLDESRYQEMIDDTLAYRTLFNRILLKILDYDDAYIDYSTRGWPESPLEQPLAGRE